MTDNPSDEMREVFKTWYWDKYITRLAPSAFYGGALSEWESWKAACEWARELAKGNRSELEKEQKAIDSMKEYIKNPAPDGDIFTFSASDPTVNETKGWFRPDAVYEGYVGDSDGGHPELEHFIMKNFGKDKTWRGPLMRVEFYKIEDKE